MKKIAIFVLAAIGGLSFGYFVLGPIGILVIHAIAGI